jgi:EAL domain-containing protein (putative c-di-GMP-specific phosphodiesterase class I)
VGHCLADHGIPAELIELEITEKIALNEDPITLSTLHAVRQLGVGMSFDDYGTGYASLSMLTEYPLTRLKIDRAFVSRMSTSPGDAAIIKAIVSLGQGFGLGLIAEGIESAEQAKALAELGCEEGQGYLFGRAMSFDEFVRHASDRATGPAECQLSTRSSPQLSS